MGRWAFYFFIGLFALAAKGLQAQTVEIFYEQNAQWQRLSPHYRWLPKQTNRIRVVVSNPQDAKKTKRYAFQNTQLMVKRGLGAPIPVAKIAQSDTSARAKAMFTDVQKSLKPFLFDQKGQPAPVQNFPIFIQIENVVEIDGKGAVKPVAVQRSDLFLVCFLTDDRPMRERLSLADDYLPMK